MREKKINKGGRPIVAERSTERLKELVIQYKDKIGNGKITFSNLEREFGISRHIWRDRKEVKELIKKLNQVDLGIDNINLTEYSIELLPNIDDLILNYKHDSNRLAQALEQYDDFVKGLIERCLSYSNFKKKYEEAIIQLDEQEQKINNLKIEVEHYKKQYFNIVSESKSKKVRDSKGINEKVIVANFSEFKSDFDSLD